MSDSPALSKSMPAASDDAGPFRARTLAILVGVVALSLLVTVVLTVLGTEEEETSAGVDTHSVSVLGHRALAALLRELDIPVVISRADSAQKARNGLLIIAEPSVTSDESRARLRDMVASTGSVLVVLPKWYGQRERGRAWVTSADYIPDDEVEPILDAVGLTGGTLVRMPTPIAYEHVAGAKLPADRPVIREPQLYQNELLVPWIRSPGDTTTALVATFAEGRVLVSDPDLLNNWGLREPANAALAVALIEELRGDGPVVIDETLHGYTRRPSLVRTLTTFPLVLATIQVLLVALLGVWAAMVRFGPKNVAPPPFAPGKDFLIRNTAALLHYGGHHADALRRYLTTSVNDVRHVLHAPALLQPQLVAWLERVRLHRNGRISLVDLEQAVYAAKTPERFLEVADQIYRWRMEMTDGSQHRS